MRCKTKSLDKVKETNFSNGLKHISQKGNFTPFADLYKTINETFSELFSKYMSWKTSKKNSVKCLEL